MLLFEKKITAQVTRSAGPAAAAKQSRRPHQRNSSLEVRQQRKSFFFEKKKQKTFDFSVRRPGQRGAQQPKVFWFFFSKKNCFLPVKTVFFP
jgi:hypothetical protein